MSSHQPEDRPSDRSEISAGNRDFEIAFAIDDVNRMLRSAFDQQMTEIGLTKSTWRLISALSREDGLSQVELSRRLGINRVSAGWLIDRLTDSGHVERRADGHDRRIWRVFLTARAQSEVEVMSGLAHKFCKEVFSAVEPADLETFIQALRLIRRQLATMLSENT
jgi:DNA-binding MarR family transcriptional regulator